MKAKLNGFTSILLQISLLIIVFSAYLCLKLMPLWFLLLELILYRVTNYDRLVTILANSMYSKIDNLSDWASISSAFIVISGQ